MTLHVKDAGTWKEVTDLYVKDAGSWKAVTNAYIKDDGTWKEFFTAAIDVVSVNAGADISLSVNDNTGNWPQVVGSNRQAVPSPSDDGNYSYSWTKLSTIINNGRPLTPSGTTTDTIIFAVSLDVPAQSSDKERWQIEVTDGNGGSVTDTIDVQYHSIDDGP